MSRPRPSDYHTRQPTAEDKERKKQRNRDKANRHNERKRAEKMQQQHQQLPQQQEAADPNFAEERACQLERKRKGREEEYDSCVEDANHDTKGRLMGNELKLLQQFRDEELSREMTTPKTLHILREHARVDVHIGRVERRIELTDGLEKKQKKLRLTEDRLPSDELPRAVAAVVAPPGGLTGVDALAASVEQAKLADDENEAAEGQPSTKHAGELLAGRA